MLLICTCKDCHSSLILQIFCTRYASRFLKGKIVNNRWHVNFPQKFVFDAMKSEAI